MPPPYLSRHMHCTLATFRVYHVHRSFPGTCVSLLSLEALFRQPQLLIYSNVLPFVASSAQINTVMAAAIADRIQLGLVRNHDKDNPWGINPISPTTVLVLYRDGPRLHNSNFSTTEVGHLSSNLNQCEASISLRMNTVDSQEIA